MLDFLCMPSTWSQKTKSTWMSGKLCCVDAIRYMMSHQKDVAPSLSSTDLGPKPSLPRVAPLALCALNSPHPVSSLTPPSFIYHGWTKSSFLHLPEQRLIEGGNKDIQQNQIAGPWATGQTSEESYNPTWPPVCSPLEEWHYDAQSAVCIKLADPHQLCAFS